MRRATAYLAVASRNLVSSDCMQGNHEQVDFLGGPIKCCMHACMPPIPHACGKESINYMKIMISNHAVIGGGMLYIRNGKANSTNSKFWVSAESQSMLGDQCLFLTSPSNSPNNMVIWVLLVPQMIILLSCISLSPAVIIAQIVHVQQEQSR